MPKTAYKSPVAPEVQFELLQTPLQLAHVLRSFASFLTRSDVPAHAVELLPKVLDYADRLQLKRAGIASACEVNEATASRWASGRTKPNPLVARFALDVVRDLALEKAHEYEVEGEKPPLEGGAIRM